MLIIKGIAVESELIAPAIVLELVIMKTTRNTLSVVSKIAPHWRKLIELAELLTFALLTFIDSPSKK